jgi:hypothetical protein
VIDRRSSGGTLDVVAGGGVTSGFTEQAPKGTTSATSP